MRSTVTPSPLTPLHGHWFDFLIGVTGNAVSVRCSPRTRCGRHIGGIVAVGDALEERALAVGELISSRHRISSTIQPDAQQWFLARPTRSGDPGSGGAAVRHPLPDPSIATWSATTRHNSDGYRRSLAALDATPGEEGQNKTSHKQATRSRSDGPNGRPRREGS